MAVQCSQAAYQERFESWPFEVSVMAGLTLQKPRMSQIEHVPYKWQVAGAEPGRLFPLLAVAKQPNNRDGCVLFANMNACLDEPASNFMS